MLALPLELRCEILKHLSPTDYLHLLRVSRKWNDELSNAESTKPVLQQRYISIEDGFIDRLHQMKVASAFDEGQYRQFTLPLKQRDFSERRMHDDAQFSKLHGMWTYSSRDVMIWKPYSNKLFKIAIQNASILAISDVIAVVYSATQSDDAFLHIIDLQSSNPQLIHRVKAPSMMTRRLHTFNDIVVIEDTNGVVFISYSPFQVLRRLPGEFGRVLSTISGQVDNAVCIFDWTVEDLLIMREFDLSTWTLRTKKTIDMSRDWARNLNWHESRWWEVAIWQPRQLLVYTQDLQTKVLNMIHWDYHQKSFTRTRTPVAHLLEDKSIYWSWHRHELRACSEWGPVAYEDIEIGKNGDICPAVLRKVTTSKKADGGLEHVQDTELERYDSNIFTNQKLIPSGAFMYRTSDDAATVYCFDQRVQTPPKSYHSIILDDMPLVEFTQLMES